MQEPTLVAQLPLVDRVAERYLEAGWSVRWNYTVTDGSRGELWASKNGEKRWILAQDAKMKLSDPVAYAENVDDSVMIMRASTDCARPWGVRLAQVYNDGL
jgi:hypothetical protein